MRKPRKVTFSEFCIKNLKPGPAPYLRWTRSRRALPCASSQAATRPTGSLMQHRKRACHSNKIAALKSSA